MAAASVFGGFAKKLSILEPVILNQLFASLVISQMFGFEFVFSNLSQFDTEKRKFLKKLIGLPQGFPSSILHLAYFQMRESDVHLMMKMRFFHRLRDSNAYHTAAFRYDRVLDHRSSWTDKFDQQLIGRVGSGITTISANAFMLKLITLNESQASNELKEKSNTSLMASVFVSPKKLKAFLFYSAKEDPNEFRKVMSFLGSTFSYSFF